MSRPRGRGKRHCCAHIYDKIPATTEIIVAQVIPARKDVESSQGLLNDLLARYNAQIPGIVDAFRAAGKHVSYVNMSGVIQSDAEFDAMGLHPNKGAVELLARPG